MAVDINVGVRLLSGDDAKPNALEKSIFESDPIGGPKSYSAQIGSLVRLRENIPTRPTKFLISIPLRAIRPQPDDRRFDDSAASLRKDATTFSTSRGYFRATTVISIRALPTRLATATVVRAGRSDLKYCV